MKKRIFSRVLALVMAVSLLSTTAFAASFADLQGAIDSVNPTGEFAGGSWSTTDTVKNINLTDNVTYGGEDDTKSITISNKNVTINMNGYTIDGGYRAEVKGADGNVTQEHATGSGQAVINVSQGSNLTLNNGNITGGSSGGGTGGGINSSNSDLKINNVNITGNTARWGGGVFFQSGTFTMENGSISDNTAGRNGGGIYFKAVGNQTTAATMKDVTVSSNDAETIGGGIFTWNTNLSLENAAVTGNEASMAGGIFQTWYSELTMTGGEITDNHALSDVGGGLCYYTDGIQSAELTGVRISGNTAAKDGGGIYVVSGDHLTLNSGNGIYSNLAQYNADTKTGLGSDIYALAGANVSGLGTPSKAPVGHQFDGWYENSEEGRNEDQYGAPDKDKITENVNLVAGLSPAAPDETPDTPETPAATLPVEGLPAAGTDTAATTIEDEEIPLAGIVTLADLLNALWEYEGIEEVELPEDFKWLDHDYAQAIYWGLDEALVVDTEDYPLDPDELLTVGLMREVLVNFVELYHGLEDFEVVLEGEDEDLVMDLGERLTVFYGELKAALEAQAA